MVRIIGIGDAKMDKNITDMIAYPGGQAMNIAVNAKLQGAQAGFIGCIGDDVLGQHLAKTLDELGVDRSRRVMAAADLVLAVVDGSDTTEEDARLMAEVSRCERPWILIFSKKDLCPGPVSVRR